MQRHAAVTSALVLLVLLASLIVYKTGGAVRQIESAHARGAVVLKADVVSSESGSLVSRVAARSINYVAAIWPALVFGILISAAVRVFVPARALVRMFSGGGVRAQVLAGASGSPLMLCSCCAAPLFASVYERSGLLAPSLAMMLAAPALNPAALTLTFLLFPAPIAWGRLGMSVLAVVLGTALVARVAPGARVGLRMSPLAEGEEALRDTPIRSFIASSLHVTAGTVPAILLGIVAAMLFADRIQAPTDLSTAARVGLIATAAAVAVPIALPTFFEIPLAITLLTVGAPAGAAAAVLFAGPAVNLASLLTVGHQAGWKAVMAVAGMVWLVAVIGGLAIG